MKPYSQQRYKCGTVKASLTAIQTGQLQDEIAQLQDEIAQLQEMVQNGKTRSKGNWRTIAGLVASNLLTLGMLVATGYGSWGTNKAAELQEKATQLQQQATLIQEATSGLNIAPSLDVAASFPGGIWLRNSGKVGAVAVTVHMKIWEGKILPRGVPAISSMHEEPIPQWLVGDIAPHHTRSIPVGAPSTQPFAGLPEELRQLRHRFIELIIQYYRAVDGKSYDQRSYYFVGKDGTWVREDDPQSNDTEFNRRIKQALQHPDYLRDRSPSSFDPVHLTTE